MKPKALFILGTESYQQIYGDEELSRIHTMCDVIAPSMTPAEALEHPELLAEAELIFSGWGGPKLTADYLKYLPQLRAVFYGAGSIRYMVTPEFWAKNITITSSWVANAVPVTELALAEILFALKQGWHYVLEGRRTHAYTPRIDCAGAFRTTVALISLGMIGKRLAKMLKSFDLNVLAYDPFATQETAAELGVTLTTLEDAFQRADVVSIHTPWLKETENLVTGELISGMKPHATLINTSRGAIIDEPAMCAVLAERPDLTAVLDVTYPEPPAVDSPLFTLPNVVLTPHIAGSLSGECRRMGQYAVDECERYLNGQPLKYQVTQAMAEKMA